MKQSTIGTFDKVCELTGATYPKGFKNPVQELKDHCRMYFLYKGELQVCLLDKEDIKHLDYNVTWVGGVNGSKDKLYIVGTWLGNKISLHRTLTNCPKGMVVDHINGNPFDNRRANIRVVTQGVNMLNKKTYSNSGITNIHDVKNGYRLCFTRRFEDLNIAIQAKSEIQGIIDKYSNMDAEKRKVI